MTEIFSIQINQSNLTVLRDHNLILKNQLTLFPNFMFDARAQPLAELFFDGRMSSFQNVSELDTGLDVLVQMFVDAPLVCGNFGKQHHHLFSFAYTLQEFFAFVVFLLVRYLRLGCLGQFFVKNALASWTF